MPIAVRNVIDQGFSVEDAANVDRYFFILLLFVLIIGFFGAMRASLVNWLGERVVADLRSKVFAHVIYMDPTFFETTKIGEVLSRLTADTTLIQSVSGVSISIVLRSSIQFIGGLILLGYTSIELLGILLIIFPLIVLPIIVVGRWLRRLSRDSQDRIADASGQAAEILGNAETVQSFTAEHLEIKRIFGFRPGKFSNSCPQNKSAGAVNDGWDSKRIWRIDIRTVVRCEGGAGRDNIRW